MSELNALLEALVSGEDHRAEEAATSLRGYGARALPPLRDLLASPDGERRWWAVRALAEIEAEGVVPLLLEALEDGDREVRHCAALALRRRPDPQALPALIARLESDDRLLASLAGDALVALGTPAVPGLIQVLERGSHAARLEAARSLAKIGDPTAIPALFEVLDKTALIDFWAQEGLERMGVGMMFFKA